MDLLQTYNVNGRRQSLKPLHNTLTFINITLPVNLYGNYGQRHPHLRSLDNTLQSWAALRKLALRPAVRELPALWTPAPGALGILALTEEPQPLPTATGNLELGLTILPLEGGCVLGTSF